MKLVKHLLAGASFAALFATAAHAVVGQEIHADETPNTFDVVVADTDLVDENAIEAAVDFPFASEAWFSKDNPYNQTYIEFWLDPSTSGAFTNDDALIHIELEGLAFWRPLVNSDLFSCQVNEGTGEVVGNAGGAFTGRFLAFNGQTGDSVASYNVSESNQADLFSNNPAANQNRLCFRLPVYATGTSDGSLKVSMETNAGVGLNTPIDGGFDVADPLFSLVDAFVPLLSKDDDDEIISVNTKYNELIDYKDIHDQHGLLGFIGLEYDPTVYKVLPGGNLGVCPPTTCFVHEDDVQEIAIFTHFEDLKGIESVIIEDDYAAPKIHAGVLGQLLQYFPYIEAEGPKDGMDDLDPDLVGAKVPGQESFQFILTDPGVIADFVTEPDLEDDGWGKLFKQGEWRIVAKPDHDHDTKIKSQGVSATMTVTLDPNCYNNTPKQGADSELDSLKRDGTELVFQSVSANSGEPWYFYFGNIGDHDAGAIYARYESYQGAGDPTNVDTDFEVFPNLLKDDGARVTNAELRTLLGNWVRGDIVFTIEAHPETVTGRALARRMNNWQEIEPGSAGVANAEKTGN